MTEFERIDFKKIIADLEAVGITPYKIASMMHRQFVQVQRWKDGREPKFHEGLMLLEIHREYVPHGTLQL